MSDGAGNGVTGAGATPAPLRWGRRLAAAVALAGALALPGGAVASLLEMDEARAFIDEVAERHDFEAAELRALFRDFEPSDRVIERMEDPAEALPWYLYRPIFVTAERAAEGAAFVDEHGDALARAEAEYGVPAEVIAAIIGVETRYGEHSGEHRVLTALATLAFAYPPRADFFRGELEQFLLLAREEGIDPRAVKGSYAGALGLPQFIPSSYRAHAVDFSGDGRRDLVGDPVDAIGSVGAYLAAHGWRAGEPIAVSAQADGDAHTALIGNGLERDVTGDELRGAGVTAEAMPAADERVSLVEVEGPDSDQLWVGHANFEALTQYNTSPLYALAVTQLATRIAARAED